MVSGYHDWDGLPPRSELIGDHAVPLESVHLQGRRIALVVSGGIAALRCPDLARALRRRGAEVTAFCSRDALPFVGQQALEWATCRPVITELTWRAEHLSDEQPFDAWLVAPATANTLAKLACGIADTPVSSALASALGRMERGQTRLLLAPTLHGSLHTSILTEHARRLQGLGVDLIAPRDAYGKHNLPDLPVLVACVCRALATGPLRGRRILVTGGPTPVAIDGVRRIVNRFSGRLAMAIAEELLLRGADPELLLGEGAATPPAWLPHRWIPGYDAYRQQVLAAVDAGREGGGEASDGSGSAGGMTGSIADSSDEDGRRTDHGTSSTSSTSSVSAAATGPAEADSQVPQPERSGDERPAGTGPAAAAPRQDAVSAPPPMAGDRGAAAADAAVAAGVASGAAATPGGAIGPARAPLAAAILSAAVADYRPRRVHPGKLPSGRSDLSLELEPTAKVIDLLRQAAPDLPMVTFKVLQGASEQELLAEARRRLARFQLVVANHAEEVHGGEQTAWLVSAASATRHQGKAAIATAIVDWLEDHLASRS